MDAGDDSILMNTGISVGLFTGSLFHMQMEIYDTSYEYEDCVCTDLFIHLCCTRD